MILKNTTSVEKIFMATVIVVQLSIGIIGDAYFPVASWNLYSGLFDPDTINAFRLEAMNSEGQYKVLPQKHQIFHQTAFNHRLRRYYFNNQYDQIKKNLTNLLDYGDQHNIPMEGLRYQKYKLEKTSGSKSKIISETIVEVSQ